MPAHKRSFPDDHPSPHPPPSPTPEEDEEEKAEQEEELPKKEEEEEDSEDEEEEEDSGAEKDEFIFVKLADIRKEVQCPICLGIIRKTRTVMECLHRFCRECIDKSMRLGNNECPACRTHCPSRRSLRDDPNYDALISALYPDIDKYEEEELAFHEEEKNRNKKIQAIIEETFRRQTEALGKKRTTAKATARAFLRKSKCRRTRGRNSTRNTSLAESEEEEDAKSNDDKDSSSADELSSNNSKVKRCKRWPTPRSSPGKVVISADTGGEDNDDMETSRENRGSSPLRVGNREMLVWGRGGVRSQMRHGNSNGANGRFVKGGRITKLVEYVRSLKENDNEFDIHLTLRPKDKQSAPTLERPHICCRPTVSIGHLCQFIALQTSVKAEEVEIFARKPRNVVRTEWDSMELQNLGLQESLLGLRDSFTNNRGEMILLYQLKTQS